MYRNLCSGNINHRCAGTLRINCEKASLKSITDDLIMRDGKVCVKKSAKGVLKQFAKSDGFLLSPTAPTQKDLYDAKKKISGTMSSIPTSKKDLFFSDKEHDKKKKKKDENKKEEKKDAKKGDKKDGKKNAKKDDKKEEMWLEMWLEKKPFYAKIASLYQQRGKKSYAMKLDTNLCFYKRAKIHG